MRRPPTSRSADLRGDRRGFTLVEVVLAMMILLIGMTTIIGLLSFGAAMSKTATLRTHAANSVEAVLLDLEEHLFPLVLVDGVEVAGEPTEIVDRAVPGYPALTYTAVATPDPDELGGPGPPLEYRVDVELSWSSQGARQKKSFTTILLREVPFGERLRQRFVEQLEPEPVEPQKEPSS